MPLRSLMLPRQYPVALSSLPSLLARSPGRAKEAPAPASWLQPSARNFAAVIPGVFQRAPGGRETPPSIPGRVCDLYSPPCAGVCARSLTQRPSAPKRARMRTHVGRRFNRGASFISEPFRRSIRMPGDLGAHIFGPPGGRPLPGDTPADPYICRASSIM